MARASISSGAGAPKPNGIATDAGRCTNSRSGARSSIATCRPTSWRSASSASTAATPPPAITTRGRRVTPGITAHPRAGTSFSSGQHVDDVEVGVVDARRALGCAPVGPRAGCRAGARPRRPRRAWPGTARASVRRSCSAATTARGRRARLRRRRRSDRCAATRRPCRCSRMPRRSGRNGLAAGRALRRGRRWPARRRRPAGWRSRPA